MKNKLFIILITSIGLVALSSCAKQLDDAYLNPNAPIVVPIESLLPNVINNMTSTALPPAGGGGGAYGPAIDGVLIGRYIQNWDYYATSDLYDQMGFPYGTASDNTGGVWAAHYYGIGQNANKIILWGSQQQKWDYVGVAYAIFGWSWLTLTEQHGEVILKEAFNTSLQQFDYDNQESVYDTVRVICNTALTYLSRTDGAVSQQNLALGDGYFYNGDVSKWKKFVYGVLARSYAHLSNKAIYTTNHYADSVIKYCNLSINANSDNATQKWQGGSFSGTNNYYGPYRGNIGTIRQSAFIANLLSGTGLTSPFTGIFDPRTPYLVRENTNGTYKGIVPNLGSSSLATADQPKTYWGGSYATTAVPTVDTSGRYIFNNLAEFPVMTASEIAFMEAEAAYRKGDMATALTAYTNGISLDFDMLTTTYDSRVPTAKKITPAIKAAYLANTTVVPTSAASLTLSKIMLQKYIALYGYGVLQTWTDMRRFHYTDLDPVTGKQVYADFAVPATISPTNNGKYVYRCRPRYNSEYLYNIPALNGIGALAGDYNTKEQWFSLP